MNNQLKVHLKKLREWTKDLSYYHTSMTQKPFCEALEKITTILQVIDERLTELEKKQETE